MARYDARTRAYTDRIVEPLGDPPRAADWPYFLWEWSRAAFVGLVAGLIGFNWRIIAASFAEWWSNALMILAWLRWYVRGSEMHTLLVVGAAFVLLAIVATLLVVRRSQQLRGWQ